jgi:hypothetical protein
MDATFPIKKVRTKPGMVQETARGEFTLPMLTGVLRVRRL